jgi:hydroxyacyl-ACP dehydratase HTD2-like protein with hotdog domain
MSEKGSPANDGQEMTDGNDSRGNDNIRGYLSEVGMSESDIEWLEPREGYEFQAGVVIVSAAHQQEKLTACGLAPAVFGDNVDPSFYIGLGIQAGIKNGISAEGNINMLSSLTQYRPIQLNEELTSHGYIESVTDVPRGKAVSTQVWFEDTQGRKVISVPRKSLKPDPVKKGAKGAGKRPAPVVENVEALTPVAQHELQPDRIKAYSSEGNSIHYEMEAANKAGFRAPIIGGGMGVHYLMASIWQSYQPRVIDLEIYFRRPIFWDDQFSVAVDERANPWPAVALVREGKVLTEARINKID